MHRQGRGSSTGHSRRTVHSVSHLGRTSPGERMTDSGTDLLPQPPCRVPLTRDHRSTHLTRCSRSAFQPPCIGSSYPLVLLPPLTLPGCLDPDHIRQLGSQHSKTGLHHPIPVHPPSPPSLFRDHSHKHLLEQEAQFLLRVGPMEEVPVQVRGNSFYSCYFLIVKAKAGLRPSLDLRCLNRYLKSVKFRMVSLAPSPPC